MALTVQDVELGRYFPFGYTDGAKPGFKATVTLQLGDLSYEQAKVTLTPEATKAVVALIVSEAMKTLTVDLDAIDVAGAPGKPKPERIDSDAVANLIAADADMIEVAA